MSGSERVRRVVDEGEGGEREERKQHREGA